MFSVSLYLYLSFFPSFITRKHHHFLLLFIIIILFSSPSFSFPSLSFSLTVFSFCCLAQHCCLCYSSLSIFKSTVHSKNGSDNQITQEQFKHKEMSMNRVIRQCSNLPWVLACVKASISFEKSLTSFVDCQKSALNYLFHSPRTSGVMCIGCH